MNQHEFNEKLYKLYNAIHNNCNQYLPKNQKLDIVGSLSRNKKLNHLPSRQRISDVEKELRLVFLDSVVVCGDDYSTLPTAYKKEHRIESTRTAKSYILIILDAIENIGNTMAPIGLVALSFVIFFMCIDAINETLLVSQLSQMTTLILLYPICWSMKTGAQITKGAFE